jgi:hypothetical protein
VRATRGAITVTADGSLQVRFLVPPLVGNAVSGIYEIAKVCSLG